MESNNSLLRNGEHNDVITNEEYNRNLYIKVRFNTGQDLEFLLPANSATTVLEIKKEIIRQYNPTLTPTKIKLIYSGKLPKDTSTINELISKNKSNHVAVEPVDVTGYGTTSTSTINNNYVGSSSSNPILLHCLIMEVESTSEESQLQQLPTLTGFDRLEASGFSVEEIDQLRQQFRQLNFSQINPAPSSNLEQSEQELYENRALQLEEAWIDNTLNNQTTNTNFASYQLLIGLGIGFFLSFLALLFLYMDAFSNGYRLGILFGILINLGFGVVINFL